MGFIFNVPSKIYLDRGISASAGDILSAEGKKKALLVCDSNLSRMGLIDGVAGSLKRSGIETILFDKIAGEPPYTLVQEAADIAKKENVDVIIGMGGGSALDTAKGTMIANANGDILQFADTFDAVEHKGVMLVLVPTTFGTGSEVTDGCVLSVPEEEKKATIWGKNTAADIALIDPELAVGLPPSITASTGMDALSHAVEAFTSPMANPVSDVIAIDAIRTILENLPECVKDGKNLESRENMCRGAMMAGIAFNNGGLNQGHELAHALGAKFHMPHGLACALSLPLVIKANGEYMQDRIRTLADLFGVDAAGKSYPVIEDELVDKIVSLRKDLGLPGFRESGIDEAAADLVGDAWDSEPKGEYDFNPDRQYIIDFVMNSL